MIRYIIASVLTGLLFGIMDGFINGNPYALKLLECYKPISRESINIPMGLLIDLIYGFVISGIYILLMPALPSEVGIIKGLVYGWEFGFSE